MKLRNIKVSFIFENDVLKTEKRQVIWKNENLTFTIYKGATKLVNVTGLKCVEEIKQQETLLEKKFETKCLKVRIDNAFFSKKDYKNIDMTALYNAMKARKDYFTNYNIELFAGMYLHPINKLYPTILVFRTGSYTIMGGKSLKLIYKTEQFIRNIIQMFVK